MKGQKKFLGLFILSALFVLIMSLNTFAGTYTSSTYRSGKYLLDEWYNSGTVNTVYHRVQVNKVGRMRVSFDDLNETSGNERFMNVWLCNANRSVIEVGGAATKLTNKYWTFYAMRKGTYYIKVQTSKDYQIQCWFEEMADQAGTYKGAARSMSKNVVYGAVVGPTEATTVADWWKFYVPSRTYYIYLDYNSIGTQRGSLKITLYSPRGTKTYTIKPGNRGVMNGGYIRLYMTDYSALAAGTYYVRVTPGVARTGLGYHLRWRTTA